MLADSGLDPLLNLALNPGGSPSTDFYGPREARHGVDRIPVETRSALYLR